MYMDEHDMRTPRERAEGDLLRHLLKEGCAGGKGAACCETAIPYRVNTGRACDGSVPGTVRVRGCDGTMRGGDRRGGEMRKESALGNNRCPCEDSPRSGCGGETQDHPNDGCGGAWGEIGNSYPCGENGVKERSLAIVYAPIQHWRDAYDPKTALSRGTLFRELDMPFYGDKHSTKGGNCRGC